MWWMAANKIYRCSSKIYTYKNIQARKKQQQAAADEDPEYWTFIIIFVIII